MASIFEKTTGNRAFIIYGQLGDIYIAENLVPSGFENFLMRYLKSIGYENVIFYDPAKKGLYAVDENSAKYMISAHTGDNKKAKNKSSQSGGMAQFVRQSSRNRRANDASNVENENMNSADEEKKVSKGENDTVRYCIKDIKTSQFEDYAEVFLKEKNAVVISNMQLYFKNSIPQRFQQTIGDLSAFGGMGVEEGILIFLVPGGTPNSIANILGGQLNPDNALPLLTNHFFVLDGAGVGYQQNVNAVLSICGPERDEIRNILLYMSMIGYEYKGYRFKLIMDYLQLDKIVDDIYCCSKNRASHPANTNLTLLKGIFDYLCEQIFEKVKDSGSLVKNMKKYNYIRIGEKEIELLFGNSGVNNDEKGVERLNKTGWEPIYNRVSEIIEELRSFYDNKEENSDDEGLFSIVTVDEDDEDDFAKENYEEKRKATNRIDPTFGQVSECNDAYQIPHFVLLGNPGVGKTSIAKSMARVLYEEGIISSDRFVSTSREEMVDIYQNAAEKGIEEKIDEARGGVLFIDEAYNLLEGEHSDNKSGERILTALLKVTNPDDTDYRECVILAGYEKGMREILSVNQGLAGRFEGNILTIPDATPEIMYEKFVKAIIAADLVIPDEDSLPLEKFFKNLYELRNLDEFANYRTLAAIEKRVISHAKIRIRKTKVDSNFIEKADFGMYNIYFKGRDVESFDDVLRNIDGLIGMEHVKATLNDIYIKIKRDKERGVVDTNQKKHFIISGNAGTGKTTLSNRIGEMLFFAGAVRNQDTIFVDASKLVSSHVNETGENVNKYVEQAIREGKLLVVDEAYQFCKSDMAKEGLAAFLGPMTEQADKFRVCFNLYEDEVEEFLKANAGLDSRINIIKLEDYTTDQLKLIFDLRRKEMNLEIEAEADALVYKILEYRYNTRNKRSGNARIPATLLSDMDTNLGRRSALTPNIKDDCLTKEDIPENEMELIKSILNPRTLEDIKRDLESKVGYEGLKTEIEKKHMAYEGYKKVNGNAYGLVPGHYRFYGRPGTGKTTGAQLFAEFLYQIGIVKRREYKYLSAKDLVGQFVGETDKKTYSTLESGIGGVIFIDEAYMLAGDARSSGTDDYRKEALAQLLLFAEDENVRKSTCIILAGYEKDMEALGRAGSGNEGLFSRFNNVVYFRDYTAEEVYEIFENLAKAEGFSVDDNVKDIYIPILKCVVNMPKYANGRTARSLFEKTREKFMCNIYASDDDVQKILTEVDALSENEILALVN